MGLGEDDYLYALAYYAWLRKPPEDGPACRRQRLRAGDAIGAIDESVARELRADQVRASPNHLLFPVLRNRQAGMARR